MKSLKDFNFEKIQRSNLHHVKGGDGATTYTISNGQSGTDCYSDDDGDGKLSKGDGVLLDDGRWIEKQ